MTATRIYDLFYIQIIRTLMKSLVHFHFHFLPLHFFSLPRRDLPFLRRSLLRLLRRFSIDLAGFLLLVAERARRAALDPGAVLPPIAPPLCLLAGITFALPP